MSKVYDKTPIFIPMDIKKDVVQSVSRKLLGGLVPGGTDLEALQRWILKFWEDSNKNYISVEIFVDWLANNNPPWAACRQFIYSCLVALDKRLGVSPVGVRENWKRIFTKCVLRVMGSKSTNACQYYQLCAGLKSINLRGRTWGSSYLVR